MNFNFMPNNDNVDPLKEYGRNLTNEALNNKLEPVIGRDDEIRRLIRILSRKTKNNPCLVGEPGVGKTAIVEGLARRIVNGNVPENLKSKEVIEIDFPAMIAGASYQGQFEKRLKSLMKKIKESKGETIVFIDEIHVLIGTGKNAQGGMDAAQIIKPMLARGEMRLIGATTLDDYRKYIESDSALERRMQKILVEEPSIESTITILRGIKERFETYHGVKIHDNALIAAAKLSTRYISDRFLPDKAIDLVDEASATIQTEINSFPEVLQKANEKVTQLEMEKVALTKEKDFKSKNRLIKTTEELEKWRKKQSVIFKKWSKEKKLVSLVANLKEQIEELKSKQQMLQINGNFEEASKIMYQTLPNLKMKLKNAETSVKTKKTTLIKEDVTVDEICKIVSQWTGIPVSKLLEQQKSKLLNLKANMEKRVKGQSHVLKLISDAILRSRADINDPNRPIGSFIFTGPTGVGKTEVAKTLALNLFDSEKSLIRIDMSEYMEAHSISKLVGSPPGYIGYGEGGQLTEKVRVKPYSVILFDEIEKAHPDVLNVLLQILDDGKITDSKGRGINFKNSIIIMTTNINALQILKGEKKYDDLKKELIKYLKPEFINRIDEIIPFNELNKKDLTAIAKNELSFLSARLNNQNIYIEFDADVPSNIAKASYDPLFGARPIKRFIKRQIESVLAHKIIAGEILADEHYKIVMFNRELVIKKKKLN